ncbi:MAG: rod shape-determining protein MreD [Deltaproteobacteria bacterium]|nr:rod shape-determining protein MreD [Deltaproteobacteria bacterium]
MIKGSLLNSFAIFRFIELDLVLIFILYFFVFFGETGAGIYAFSLGLVTDVLSGGAAGIFSLIYLIVFLGFKLGSRPFDLFSPGGQVIVLSLAVVLKKILIFVFISLFSLESIFSFPVFLKSIFSAISTGLVGSLIFFFLNQLDHLFQEPVSKKSSL